MPYSGTAAYAIEAIGRRAFAPAMAQHGFLALMFALHGGSGLPEKWLSQFENVKQRLGAQTALSMSEVPVNQVAVGKKDFHYIIMRDADINFRTSPMAFGTQQNWDSTDVSDRLYYSAKRVAERPAVFGEDAENLDGTQIVGSYLDKQIAQKTVKLVNGLAYQLINGLGSGSDLTGFLGLNPVSSTTNVNGFGGTTAGFTSHTIGGLSVTAAVNPELLPKQYPTAIVSAIATNAENLLKYLSYAARYVSRPSKAGAVIAAREEEHTALESVFRKAHQQIPGVSYSSAGFEYLTYIMGKHFLYNGVPIVEDAFVPSAHFIGCNMQTTGLRHKGKGLIQWTDIVDLAKIGYEIGSKGVAIEAHCQMVSCMPTNLVCIPNWNMT